MKIRAKSNARIFVIVDEIENDNGFVNSSDFLNFCEYFCEKRRLKKISLKKFRTRGKLHCKVDINEDINDESEWLPIWLPCISTYLRPIFML